MVATGVPILKSLHGMTRPGKIPSLAGFELRTFRFRGGRLNHLANEAVEEEEGTGCSGPGVNTA